MQDIPDYSRFESIVDRRRRRRNALIGVPASVADRIPGWKAIITASVKLGERVPLPLQSSLLRDLHHLSPCIYVPLLE